MLSSNQKKIIAVIIVLILAVVGFLFLRKNNFIKGPGSEDNKLPQESQVPEEIERKSVEEIPVELPADLPFEEGQTLIRNEVLTSPTTNEIQFARGYYSQKTVNENYEIFKKYLNDNGWKILFDTKEENYAMLGSTKSGVNGNLQITVSKNSVTGDVTVQTVLSRQK
jgi:hypothetical protein